MSVLVFVIRGTHWLIWAASHALRERTKALQATKVAKIAMVLRPLLQAVLEIQTVYA